MKPVRRIEGRRKKKTKNKLKDEQKIWKTEGWYVDPRMREGHFPFD